MRPGGGHAKGAEFERWVCSRLSLWVSSGQRADLFTRNVLSGGRFTNAMKKGDAEHGMPGDLMAAHPLAFAFASVFLVECKHYADIGLESFLFDRNGKSFLWRTLALAKKQAQHAQLLPMVIARQNRMEPIVLCQGAIMAAAAQAAITNRGPLFRYHTLHNASVGMARLDDFAAMVRPEAFLECAAQLRNEGNC